ncbi:hypothetical protein BpHYR1_023782 [Brachionus plicatilis]|uniref:Uncharacterized protein n=1 Tax=Brachionus plicatilis TaxID=10195 RepID=A0A3M7QDM9_BRAPC|nr:hypothetical protein BpHYR1_023782 [Brachionus plicatilis]
MQENIPFQQCPFLSVTYLNHILANTEYQRYKFTKFGIESFSTILPKKMLVFHVKDVIIGFVEIVCQRTTAFFNLIESGQKI